MTSGAVYRNVPTFAFNCTPCRILQPKPKSMTFTVNASSASPLLSSGSTTRMFSGLMSLCTMPTSWSAARPCSSCLPSPRASSWPPAGRLPASVPTGAWNHSSNVVPSHSSMCTSMNIWPRSCAPATRWRTSWRSLSTVSFLVAFSAWLPAPNPSSHSNPSESAEEARDAAEVDRSNAARLLPHRGLQPDEAEAQGEGGRPSASPPAAGAGRSAGGAASGLVSSSQQS
mmetsp:Transcript_7566/g.22170  ORF Transcript_7566/g.22170 Transcript_7566/m.22170 type:complete len:228 (+) Transcript_7566:833-1516(+)